MDRVLTFGLESLAVPREEPHHRPVHPRPVTVANIEGHNGCGVARGMRGNDRAVLGVERSPIPIACSPPKERQTMSNTAPVGDPPLYTMIGRTSP